MVTIVGTIIGTILAVEARCWMPHVSFWLVRVTLAKLPDGLDGQIRSRWSEEIESDLASFDDRPLGGLLFALRLWRRGGRRLGAELALGEGLDEGRELEEPQAGETLRLVGVRLVGQQTVCTYERGDGRRIYLHASGSNAPKVPWIDKRDFGSIEIKMEIPRPNSERD
jgi:hypothetical protein